jgi:hypothetical protein
MNEMEKHNIEIIGEANKILHDYGVLSILNKYGSPFPTGSFLLGVMTWRDLDIYLESNNITESRFFQLGGEAAAALKPQKMHYKNEFLAREPNLPVGFYWGIYVTGLVSHEEWKIDLWAIDSEQRKSFQKEIEKLQTKLNTDNRLTILEIKNHFYTHPDYRRKFGSVDIYRAVIDQGIKSVSGFAKWLEKDRGIV